MNPQLVTTGHANGTPIQVDVSGVLTQDPVPTDVTLNSPYTLSDPMPVGYPVIPSRTGSVSTEYPGQTFPPGTVLGLVQQEATALIAAGATTTFPGFASISVPAGSNPTLTVDVNASLDTTAVPAASAFSVLDNGVAVTVSSVAVSANSVSLVLSGTVASADVVVVTYTPPGVNSIQNTTGQLLAPINAASATVT